MKLLAHISDDKTRTQTIEEHLISTAALARKLCRSVWRTSRSSVYRPAHDIGKYSAGFQQQLAGRPCPLTTPLLEPRPRSRTETFPPRWPLPDITVASPTSEIRMILPTKAHWSAAPSGGSKIAPSGNRRSPLPKPLCRRGCSASRTT